MNFTDRLSTAPFMIVPKFTHGIAGVEITNHDTGEHTKEVKIVKFFRWLWFAYCYSSVDDIYGDYK